MSDKCIMCNKPANPQAHLFPGPIRTWLYAPGDTAFTTSKDGTVDIDFAQVRLHSPCVGSFIVLNQTKNLLVQLKND